MNFRRQSLPIQGKQAFAVIFMLGILAFMGAFVLHNSRNLAHLENELRLVEKGQVKRLNDASADPNAGGRTSNAQR